MECMCGGSECVKDAGVQESEHVSVGRCERMTVYVLVYKINH